MKITATLLILSSVLHVKAIPAVVHEDIAVKGCSDTDKNINKEVVYGVDGEVLWYADFKQRKGVEPQPRFVDHITYPEGYPVAVADQEACKHNLNAARTALKNLPVELDAPHTMIYSRDEVLLGVDNVLICHVTGFYPAPVTITWTRNSLNLTSNFTTTVPYLNKDGTFIQFSSLKFRPEQGDIYSCTVNHQSLPGPESMVWDVDHDIPAQPGLGPDVFCGVGLTLGALGVAMGTFFLIKGNECN